MATLLFYQEPAVLNREDHRNLKLKKQDNLEFAKDINSVPVAGFEFFNASRDFPVVFTKDSKGEYLPVVLLSLKAEGNNLWNNWREAYMPAFVRRYPFALSNDGMVIIDKQAVHLQEDEGEPLFNQENGENTEVLDEAVKFLHYMDRQYKATTEFTKACAERELFEPFNVQVDIGAEKPVRLSSLYVIDEKKLNGLKDEDVTEFFRKGWLAWAYAHMHSLSAVGRVARRDRESSES